MKKTRKGKGGVLAMELQIVVMEIMMVVIVSGLIGLAVMALLA